MNFLNILAVLALAYIIGAIPFGLIIVKIANGQDIRFIGSGRIGGTNVMRAAGWFAGLLTALFDVAKGIFTYYLVLWLAPGLDWLRVLADSAAILGQIQSIFLIEKNSDGKIRLRGGAGGATAFGGAVSLMLPSFTGVFIILPFVAFIYLVVGFASVTTMSIPLLAGIYFLIQAISGISPWVFAGYGIVGELIVLWALRPNIQRLIKGTERSVGLRAYLEKKRQQKT